jgi:predicted aconitase
MDPIDLPLVLDQHLALAKIFNFTDELERLNLELGLRSPGDWSCACYEPEMGNTPEFGDYLAWSESSAITFANSVLGARTNRNPIGIDMLCSILGKAPYFGLMTDRGRLADWLIEVETSRRCSPQVLGSTIGLRVLEGVPFIVGLDRYLSRGAAHTADYLKDLGAAIAGNGGVGLIHIEGITPEAVRWGRDLLAAGFETAVIDDDEIERVRAGYPNLWKHRHGKPKRVFLGCPHLTVGQIVDWGRRIVDALEAIQASTIGIPTHLFASSHVRKAFEHQHPELAGRLQELGVTIPSNCPMMWCSTPLEDAELVATNSNKTRVYTTARFFDDDVLAELVATGELPEGVQ